MKWDEIDTSAPGDGCQACCRAFVSGDDVRVCAECDLIVHTMCFLRHLATCARRRN